MTKKRTSIEVQEETLAECDREAKRYGISRNAVVQLKLNKTLALNEVPREPPFNVVREAGL